MSSSASVPASESITIGSVIVPVVTTPTVILTVPQAVSVTANVLTQPAVTEIDNTTAVTSIEEHTRLLCALTDDEVEKEKRIKGKAQYPLPLLKAMKAPLGGSVSLNRGELIDAIRDGINKTKAFKKIDSLRIGDHPVTLHSAARILNIISLNKGKACDMSAIPSRDKIQSKSIGDNAEIWQIVEEVYNSEDKTGSRVSFGGEEVPDEFKEINADIKVGSGHLTGEVACRAMKKGFSDYRAAERKATQSGTHETIFMNFCPNKIALYIHFWLKECGSPELRQFCAEGSIIPTGLDTGISNVNEIVPTKNGKSKDKQAEAMVRIMEKRLDNDNKAIISEHKKDLRITHNLMTNTLLILFQQFDSLEDKLALTPTDRLQHRIEDINLLIKTNKRQRDEIEKEITEIDKKNLEIDIEKEDIPIAKKSKKLSSYCTVCTVILDKHIFSTCAFCSNKLCYNDEMPRVSSSSKEFCGVKTSKNIFCSDNCSVNFSNEESAFEDMTEEDSI